MFHTDSGNQLQWNITMMSLLTCQVTKKVCTEQTMGLLNHVEILINFTVKYGFPLAQYIVYPNTNSKTKSFSLVQVNTDDHFIVDAGATSELAGITIQNVEMYPE